jgi:AAA domain/Primase C terminal 2 (PriCT-2)/Bifunctional DNA primase/polymerase, N-terminal
MADILQDPLDSKPIRWRGIDPCRAMYSYGTEVRAMGYQIVPVRYWMKRPSIRGWPTIEADNRDIAKWIANDGRASNGSSIGIVTTRTPALDVDCMDPEFIAEFKARIWQAFGCPPVRVGNAPKLLMLFRTLEPFKKEASASYIDSEGRRAQLEILGKGQQFVAYGIHPDTNKPYEWTGLEEPLNIRADQLPILTAEMREQAITAFEELCEARGWQRKGRSKGVQRGLAESGDDGPKDRLGLSVEELRELVMTIPNDDTTDIEYEGEGLTWINVMSAIHHESAGSPGGMDIAVEWSIQSGKHNSHDEDRFSIAWNSFKPDHPNPRTARSLIAWAREFNPDLWMASEIDAVDDALGDAATPEPRKPASSKGVEIHTGEQIIMEAVEWIWSGYLARGKFHVLGGQKGAGKSTITFSFAATITKGGTWPDGCRAPLGNVLIWSGEDDMSDTIMPRIAAMGGDIKRVHFVKSITDQGKKRRFDPATDLPRLVEAMRAVPDLRMVIIDPIVSASKNDSHKNAETRRGLQPVVDLAEELRVVVIGLTHFTKNTQGKDPIERITGTLA